MTLAEKPCRLCNAPGPQTVTLRTSGVHYAEVRCVKCKQHLGFQSKPDSDPTKYKRPKAHTDLVKQFSKGYCEMCMRPQADLPKGETLEAQHVVEFQNGGSCEKENIWIVCTGCHRLIHWRRTYIGPRQELTNRAEEVRSLDPLPQQLPGENDTQYLERIAANRRERQQ